MRQPLKVAVLGGGFIGQAHIHAWRQIPGIVVGTLVDHVETKARAKAEFWDIPQWSTEWGPTIEDPAIDIIDNCLPNIYHQEVILQAAKRGKPLFTEKPLVADLVELAAVAEIADRALIGVNFNYRFFPQIELFRRSASDELGRVCYADGRYWQDWRLEPNSSTGRIPSKLSVAASVVMDIGVHWIDLFEFVTGDAITHVHASVADDESPTCTVTVLFVTRTNSRGCVSFSQGAPGYKNRLILQLRGEKRTVYWDQEMPDLLHVGTVEGGWQVTPRDQSFDFSQPTAAPYPAGHIMGWPSALGLALAHFIVGVRRGRLTSPTASLQEGIHNMLVAGAILRSLDTNYWVAVDDNTSLVS
jgi:predicted dehydrogenase